MKKYLLLLLLLFLFMPSNGQTPIAEKGLIQTNAEKWFKEVYFKEIGIGVDKKIENNTTSYTSVKFSIPMTLPIKT